MVKINIKNSHSYNIFNRGSIWGSKLKYMAQSQFFPSNSGHILQIFVKWL
jgi:hypothetical protein